MTPRHSTQGPGGVLDGKPLGLPLRGSYGGLAAEHTTGGGGPGRDHRRGPSPRCTSTLTGDKDRGLSDGVALHGEWDRAGDTGMV